ncbi:MAG: glycosyltransferase, partial [Aquisalinus sp.]|nr:glycosyltransferase [Aquisalinus sp.]
GKSVITMSVSRQDLKVVACVTAYNEEATVGEIVRALKACEAIDQVQVVDDGSEDGTRAAAEAESVKVISLETRVPVGQAIMRHLDDLDEECILLWCDADLVNLKPEYMADIVQRFKATSLMQVMSSRGVPLNWPAFLRCWPIANLWGWFFGPISGERAILKSDFQQAITLAQSLEWEEMMRGYGIVLFLNWYSNVFGQGIEVRYFDQLRQRQKYQKWGRAAHFQMWRQWLQFGLCWLKIRVNAGKIKAKRQALLPGS